jgi:hypothetical protein
VRFVPSDSQIWGLNFERHTRRKNESALWAPIPKAYTLTRVSMAGELHGLSGVSRGLDLRLKPFVVGGVHDLRSSETTRATDTIRDIGLDARYGLTAGLNMDVTINTDFAQVEVDEQQVNLTRFGCSIRRSATFSWRIPTSSRWAPAPRSRRRRCRPICFSAAASAFLILVRRSRFSAACAWPENPAPTILACSTSRPTTRSGAQVKTSLSAVTAATS